MTAHDTGALPHWHVPDTHDSLDGQSEEDLHEPPRLKSKLVLPPLLVLPPVVVVVPPVLLPPTLPPVLVLPPVEEPPELHPLLPP